MDYDESLSNNTNINSNSNADIVQSSDGQRPTFQIRILVVDDDPTTLSVIASMLQIWSYEVETAKNPLDALATLRMQNGSFDLVVTDLHMPFMNGFELKKQIDKEFRLPVIMISADDKETVYLQSLHCGIVLHITKPVKPDDLKDVWQFAMRARKGKSVAVETGNNSNDPCGNIGLLPSNQTLDHHNQTAQGLSVGGGSSSGNSGALVLRNPENSTKRAGNNGDSGTGKAMKKPCYRKDPNQEHAPRRRRRTKVVWTNSLHNRFLLSIRHLGYDKAVPKRILEFMNVPGLTRENVASHLQKYRLFLRRVAENGVLDATRMLADRFMRSSFASGYPIQLMLQHAQQMYPHLYRRSRQRFGHSIDHPFRLPHTAPTFTANAVAPPPRASPSSFRVANIINHNSDASGGRVPLPPAGLSLLVDNRSSVPTNIVRQPCVTRAPTTTVAVNYPRCVNTVTTRNLARLRPAPPRRNQSYNNTATGMYTLAVGDNLPGNGNSNHRARGRRNINTGPGSSRFNQGGVSNAGGPGMTRSNQQGLNNPGCRFDMNRGSGSGMGIISTCRSQSQPSAFFRHNMMSYEQRSPRTSNTAHLPPPPRQPQYANGLSNMGRGSGNRSYNNNMTTKFGGSTGYVDPLLNQTNQLPTLPLNYELRVEDYASDLSDLAFEDVNASRNQAPSIQNRPDIFTGGRPSAYPVPNGGQSFRQNSGDNALPSDDYFPSMINQIALQPQRNEQALYNLGGNALQSDGYRLEPANQTTSIQLYGDDQQVMHNSAVNDSFLASDVYVPRIDQSPPQLYGNDQQVTQNPVGRDDALLPTDVYTSCIDQTPLQFYNDQEVLQNPACENANRTSDVYAPEIDETPQLYDNDQQVLQNLVVDDANIRSDAYVPVIDQNPPQQPGSSDVGDPFEHIDLENLNCEVDWDDFMNSLLNDQEAPDLKE